MEKLDLSQRITLSVDEAITALGVGRTMMYELLGNGSIQSFKVGKKRLIRVSSIMEWIAEQESYGFGYLGGN
jgi:excisionase family DNA binding protein